MTYWRVQVFGGVVPSAAILERAPIALGVPEITIDGDGNTSGPRIPVVYEPVLLETRSPGSVSLFADGLNESIHVMENVWHVYFGLSGIEIEGLETRLDGVAVWSRWEAEPCDPPERVQKLLTDMFGDE